MQFVRHYFGEKETLNIMLREKNMLELAAYGFWNPQTVNRKPEAASRKPQAASRKPQHKAEVQVQAPTTTNHHHHHHSTIKQ